MCGRYALYAVIALGLASSGCNGCLVRGEPELTKGQVVVIANEALERAGYDLTKVSSESVRASYQTDSCSSFVTYNLYTGRLPAGPMVFVNDRIHVAGIDPGM